MIYLLIVSVIWSLSFSLIKGYLTELDPYFVSFFRLLISLIVFLPFLQLKKLNSRIFFHLLLIGGLQYGFMYTAYINAYQYLQAFQIAILTIFTPFFVVLIYDLWSKEFVPIHWIKAFAAIIGAGIILYSDKISLGFWKGILLIQISNFLFALGQVYYKNIVKQNNYKDQKQSFAILFLGSVIVSGFFSYFFTDYGKFTLGTNQILVLLYLGVIASGLSFFLWNYGVTKSNAGTIAIMNNLKIPFGVIFAMVLLSEHVNIFQLLAGSLFFVFGLFLDRIIKQFKVKMNI